MNTKFEKYSKLIARILSIIFTIIFLIPLGLSITSMKEVLNEYSGNSTEQPTGTTNQETLEWIEWKVTTTPWYNNNTTTKITTEKPHITTTSSTTTMSTTNTSVVPVTTTTVTNTTTSTNITESTTIATTVVIPETEIIIVEEPPIENTYEEEIVIELPQETEAPQPIITEPEIIETDPPIEVIEEYIEPSNDDWYYPTLLTHDGYQTTFSYEGQQILKKYCDDYGVDYELMLAVIAKESGYNQYVSSYCGAIGLCQVMPITITQFNWDTGIYYDNYYSLEANIHVGVHTMAACIRKYGNMYDGLTAYNCGLYSSSVGYYNSYSENALALRDKILALK